MNIVSIIILSICFFGILIIKKNLILVLLIIELLLLAINIHLVFASILLDDAMGQILILFILTIAAAETSIGLALLISFYRLRGIIKSESLYKLKI
jgi:NADH-quinone oxidoreductase subunit K